jgi:hypothetical protein
MSCAGVPVCRPRAVPNKQKLTSLTVTKLRPTARPFLVWDSYQRGLALQIQPSGYCSFKLIYRFHNRPRWYHIGAADAIALRLRRRPTPLMAPLANWAGSKLFSSAVVVDRGRSGPAGRVNAGSNDKSLAQSNQGAPT